MDHTSAVISLQDDIQQEVTQIQHLLKELHLDTYGKAVVGEIRDHLANILSLSGLTTMVVD
jgi:hypothetical protein